MTKSGSRHTNSAPQCCEAKCPASHSIVSPDSHSDPRLTACLTVHSCIMT
jgi:hypothetical protein